MSASVPEQRADIVLSDGAGEDVTAISRSVRSVSWVDAARLQCWIAGRGATLIPAHGPMALEEDEARTFRYRVHPRYQGTRWAYAFTLVSTEGVASSTTVTIPVGGTAYTVPVHASADVATPTTIVVERAARDATEDEVSFEVAGPGDTALQLESFGLEELPRAILDVDADDLGADRLRFWVRQPIMEPTLHDQILAAQPGLVDGARRCGLFHHCVGVENAWLVTSGTPVDLFDAPVPIIPRRIVGTTSTIAIRVLARCTDGSTVGGVEVANGGGSVGIEVSGTDWEWFPADDPATLLAPSEDPSTADGVVAGDWSTHDHTITAVRTSGSGTVQIATISIFEPR